MSAMPSLGQVFAILAREGLVADEWSEALASELEAIGRVQPWYIRAMVGFGAWIASLLLIAFAAGIGLAATDGGLLALGIVFMTAAVFIRRRLDQDFTNQLSLSGSLAGMGLVGAGLLQLDWAFGYVLLALIAINAVLLVLFRDKTHRFLSVVIIVGSLTLLLYVWEVQFLVPLVGPMLAGGLVLALRFEHELMKRGWYEASAPIAAGILIGAFGCLLLSGFYVLPELAGDYQFYPRPWVSSVLLGALLLFCIRDIVDVVFGASARTAAVVAYGLTVCFVAVAHQAPGLVLALVILAAASLTGHAIYRAAGLVFLVVFAGVFFYGIEVGMLAKSAVLIATGVLLLGCRSIFLFATRSLESEHHA